MCRVMTTGIGGGDEDRSPCDMFVDSDVIDFIRDGRRGCLHQKTRLTEVRAEAERDDSPLNK